MLVIESREQPAWVGLPATGPSTLHDGVVRQKKLKSCNVYAPRTRVFIRQLRVRALTGEEENERTPVLYKRERGRIVRLLTTKINLIEDHGVRVGYILATLLAGISGGVSLTVSSAVFLLAGDAVDAPPALSAAIAVVTSVLVDLGRLAYSPVLGYEAPNLSFVQVAFPIFVYSLVTLATATADFGFSLQPPARTPDQALDRMRNSKQQELDQIQADERADIRRELGLTDATSDQAESGSLTQSQLEDWDRKFNSE